MLLGKNIFKYILDKLMSIRYPELENTLNNLPYSYVQTLIFYLEHYIRNVVNILFIIEHRNWTRRSVCPLPAKIIRIPTFKWQNLNTLYRIYLRLYSQEFVYFKGAFGFQHTVNQLHPQKQRNKGFFFRRIQVKPKNRLYIKWIIWQINFCLYLLTTPTFYLIKHKLYYYFIIRFAMFPYSFNK